MESTAKNELHKTMLADNCEIKIRQDQPVQQRVRQFLDDGGNPYCYCCGSVEVRVEFTDQTRSLQSRLEQYLSAKKLEP